jgi:hypothetical protein
MARSVVRWSPPLKTRLELEFSGPPLYITGWANTETEILINR